MQYKREHCLHVQSWQNCWVSCIDRMMLVFCHNYVYSQAEACIRDCMDTVTFHSRSKMLFHVHVQGSIFQALYYIILLISECKPTIGHLKFIQDNIYHWKNRRVDLTRAISLPNVCATCTQAIHNIPTVSNFINMFT